MNPRYIPKQRPDPVPPAQFDPPPFKIEAPSTLKEEIISRTQPVAVVHPGTIGTTTGRDAYLRLKGVTTGDIKGSVTLKGRENSIRVIATSHDVISPRDAASGLPTGKRQHKPFIITKEIDKSSPLLYNALVNNENLHEWVLTFYRVTSTGAEVPNFTIRLTNASIAGIRHEMSNSQLPDNMQHEPREHVSFCYQKIEWTFTDGGITAEDDWEAPVA